MSIRSLKEAIEGIPYSLSDQVLSYSRSVSVALPEIFDEAGVAYNRDIADQVVFLAGVRKLFSIIDSAYWVIDNASAILEKNDMHRIRVGGTNLSRGADYHYSVEQLRKNLIALLEDNNIYRYIADQSYVEIVRDLSSGH